MEGSLKIRLHGMLFGKSLSFVYDEEEEAGIEQYMRQVRKAWKEES